MMEDFLTKTALLELLAEKGLAPNKRLGQNFLVDRNVRDKFLSFAEIGRGDTVLEIGPGLGALTGAMCERAGKVVAFEKDPVIAEILEQRLSGRGNLEVIARDFLSADADFFTARGPFKVIGNLPYYIASPIILHLLRFLRDWNYCIVSLPAEVGKKIVASPGERDYGFLAVVISMLTKPRIRYTMSRHVFYPAPEIESVLLEMVPREKAAVEIGDEKTFWEIVPGLFANRRKTILNVLNRSFKLEKNGLNTKLRAIGIDPAMRSHQLDLAQLAAIARLVKEAKGAEK